MKIGLGIVAFCLFTGSALASQSNPTNDDIASKSFEKWLVESRAAGRDPVEMEKLYAIAVGTRNNEVIESSPEKSNWEEVQSYLTTITKGSGRVSDRAVYAAGANQYLYSMKSNRILNQTIDGLLNSTPSNSKATQNDLWSTYRSVYRWHLTKKPEIEKYHRMTNGYSVKQFFIELDGLGNMMETILNKRQAWSMDRKRHMIALFIKLLNMTKGEDPEPYDISGEMAICLRLE